MRATWLVALGLFAAGPKEAGAQEPVEGPAAPPPGDGAELPPPPAAQLRSAKEAWILGDGENARAHLLQLLQRSRNAGDVEQDVTAEAWVYLGEIQLKNRDWRAAEASFRMALQLVPDMRLSRFEHPDDVIGVFSSVKDAMAIEQRDATDARVPMPWWGYAPFGVPQFRQRRPVRGGVYAALQVGFAAASVGAWIAVDRQVAAIDRNPAPDDEEAAQAQRQRAIRLRNVFSFTTAGAFYVVWGASVVDSGISWRRDRVAPSSVGVTPRPDGVDVTMRWRF